MSTNTAIVIGVVLVGGALWHAGQVNRQIAEAAKRSGWEQIGGLGQSLFSRWF